LHTVITGDISNTAGRSEFLKGIQFLSGIGRFSGISIIPGNHDVNIQKFRFGANKKVSIKLDRFLKYFKPYMKSTIPLTNNNHPFPYVKIIDGQIALIGLDSTVYHFMMNTRGEIGSEQLDRLRQILAMPELKGLIKIVLIHHHVTSGHREHTNKFKTIDRFTAAFEGRFMNCIVDAKDLIRILIEGEVNLILHGHKHSRYIEFVENMVVVCAGSAVHEDPQIGYTPSYQIFEVSPTAVQIYVRIWNGRSFENQISESFNVAFPMKPPRE
jgi:3',5'-cyclic AMP phosphodiesterase CpdA